MKKVKVGLIGCGAIGNFVAEEISTKLSSLADITCLFDIDASRAENLKKRVASRANIALRFSDVFSISDLVVECASQEVVPQVLNAASRYRINVVIMSVGALLGNERLINDLKSKGIKVHIPSGAIAGLDAIRALGREHIKSLHLTTFKPPQALMNAPFIKKEKIDLSRIKQDTVIFEGKVKDAVKNFPQNINVAATLSIISGCEEKMSIKIVASPSIDKNIHHIILNTDSGELEITCQNIPSRENPRTSKLAMLSCFSEVREAVEDTLQILSRK